MEAWHPWAAVAAVTSMVALRYWGRGVSDRWRLARRRRLAARGEVDAERILAREGYRVVKRQAERAVRYARDGEPVIVTVRADLVVARGGRRFVAEVKTGRSAPKLETKATRRQLLEYAHAFDGEVDGLLLVDATSARVHRLTLPSRRRALEVGPLALACVLGAALGALALHFARAS